MGALLLGAAAWAGAGAPAQAHPHALAARLHARQLHLDPLVAAATVVLADIWLALGALISGLGRQVRIALHSFSRFGRLGGGVQTSRLKAQVRYHAV